MSKQLFILLPLLASLFCIPAKAAAPSVKKEITTGFYNVPDSSTGLYVEVIGKNGFNRFKIPMNKDGSGNYYQPGDFLAIDITNYTLNHKSPIEIYIGDSKGNQFLAGNGAVAEGDFMYGLDSYGTMGFRNTSANCVWSSGALGKSTLLIDYKKLKDGYGSIKYTEKVVEDIAWVQFGFSTSFNIGQKNSVEKIYTVNYGDEIFDYSTPAFCNEDGFIYKPWDVFSKYESHTLYDFTALNPESKASDLGWTLTSADTGSVLKGVNYCLGSTGRGVVLANSLENSVVFSFKSDSNTSSSDEKDPHYSSDLFAYIDLWKAEPSHEIPARDGLAFKICTTYSGTPIRIVLTDGDDGELFYTGSTKLKTAYDTYNYLTDDATNLKMNGYWNCLWPNRAAGTAYFPYGSLIHDDLINKHTKIEGGDGKLTNISKIQLAFDTAGDYCYDFAVAIGAIADVDVISEDINVIFDTATYTANQANETDARLSTVCVPDSEDFKNYNWKLSRLTADKLVSRASMDRKYRGDVKILQDFSRPANISAEDAQYLAANYSPLSGQKQYVSIEDNGDEFKGALKWTIGDYDTEYSGGADATCTIKAISEGSTLVPYWYDMSSAKGLSIYVKNVNNKIARFALEFGYDQKNGKYQHFGINALNTIVYAYDIKKDRTYTLVCDNTIFVPKGFEGFIRIPFTAFTKPMWNVEGSDIFDGSCSLLSINLSTFMMDASKQTLIIDEIGMYYSNFSVSNVFNTDVPTFKECLEMDYFGE